MRIMKLASFIVMSGLFLTVNFLMLTNPSICRAQSRSAAPNLVNTAWKGSEISFETSSGSAIKQDFYLFEKDGKVINKGLAILRSQIKGVPNRENPMYNPFGHENPYEWKLTVTPGMIATAEMAGKYELNGKTLYMDFSGWSVTATINGDVMKGMTTKKESNEKEEWIVRKISNVEKQSEKVPETSPDSISPAQSLSKQIIEKYSPTRITNDIILGQLKPENNGKASYYTFIAGPGEITITMTIESQPDSWSNGAQFVLMDSNERILGSGTTMSNFGRTMQAVETINISSKQPILLRIQEYNNGFGKYRVQLSGAVETGEVR
jgi:hypothetical protein